MTTNTGIKRPIKISDRNYQELRKIKHKNMESSIDAALTIALGTYKQDLKLAKKTKKDQEIADKFR